MPHAGPVFVRAVFAHPLARYVGFKLREHCEDADVGRQQRADAVGCVNHAIRRDERHPVLLA